MVTGQELVPYEGRLPSVVPAASIIESMSGDLIEQYPALSLLGDVQVSTYGAIGLNFLDAKPENGTPWGKDAGDYWAIECYDETQDIDGNEVRYGARQGFKVVRYTVIPQQLLKVLDTNKWVGPAVLREALERDVDPIGDAVAPEHAFYMTGRDQSSEEERIKQFIAKAEFAEHVLKSVGGIAADGSIWRRPLAEHPPDFGSPSSFGSGLKLPDNHRAYASYMPWVYFGVAQEGFYQAVTMTLGNIDSLIEMTLQGDHVRQQEIVTSLAEDPAYLPVLRDTPPAIDA